MSMDLLEGFDRAMHGNYNAARCLNPPVVSHKFRSMLCERGGKATADHLLAGGNPASGFADLFMSGKDNLRLSVEYLVLSEPWRQLFTKEQLDVARKRLMDVNCPLPPVS